MTKTPFDVNGSGTITISDADLLFSGDYARQGVDLILSKGGRKVVLEDYFRGEKRSSLASPDGAMLSSSIIDALTGHTQYAQAGGGAAPVDIGQVSKLTGSATVIRNGVSIALNLGDRVYKGDVVQAGGNSALGITFIDGSVFSLSSNARMALNDMVYDPNGSSNSALLSLVQGTISFVAGETAKKGDMKVDTPVATMGIRGTAVLVEIGFEVQGQAGAPPVKFQVLVEPGNVVGSYVLLDKSTGQQIGVVNQAGQVTSVTGTGTGNVPLVAVTPAPPLSPEAAAVVQQALQTYFPTYTPPSAQPTTPPGSPPPDARPVDPGANPRNINLPVGEPTTVTIEARVQGSTTTTPVVTSSSSSTSGSSSSSATTTTTVTIPVVITRFNAAPVIEVRAVADSPSFVIANQVTITDPDATNPDFNDEAVPYVAGSARILKVVGPTGGPSEAALTSAIQLDAQTGAVTHAPGNFTFLQQGQSVVVTIAFNARSGPDTVTETLTYTINGSNDGPTISVGTVAIGGIGFAVGPAPAGAQTEHASGTINFVDPDLGDVHTVQSVTYTGTGAPIGHLVLSLNADGSTGAFTWVYEVDDAALNAALASSSTGVRTETFNVTISDGHGGTATQAVTVTLTGNNANVYIGTNGNFLSASNWSRGVAPASGDFAYVNATTPVALSLGANGQSVAGLKLADGGHIDISATNGPTTFAINGAFVNGGDIVLAPNVTLSVQGTIQNSGNIVVDVEAPSDPFAALLINGTVVLDGSGKVTLDGAVDRIVGATAAATLENKNNTINGFGLLGAGQLNIVNDAAGKIIADDARGAIVVDTGAGTFVNHGTISSTAVGGLEIMGSLVNDGTLFVSAGILRVHGAVSGHGSATISGSATQRAALVFDGASDVNVTFVGASADHLVLGAANLFTGTVTGLALGDTIDLGAGNISLVDYAGGVEVHYGPAANQFFRITGTFHAADFGVQTSGGVTSLIYGYPNHAPVVTSVSLSISEGGTTVLSPSNISVSDFDGTTSFTFTASAVTHGVFETSTDGVHWGAATSFTSAQLAANHVRFVHDGGEAAPTFSLQADDGASLNNLSNTQAASVSFTNVNDPPVVRSAFLTISEGGTVVLSSSNIAVSDPDGTTSFTFTVSNVTHGVFETSTDGVHWTAATSFTSAQLDANHVRFTHDGDEIAPTFSLQANDGAALNNLSNTQAASISFTNVNDAPVINSVSLSISERGTVVLSSSNISVGDPDSTLLTFTASAITHGMFQTSADGTTWTNAITFTSAQLAANHVRFVHDGSQAAPTFSLQANDGAALNNLSNTQAANVTFININRPPSLNTVSLSLSEGAATVLSSSNISVSDPDSTSFTFTASNVTHGRFQISSDGTNWTETTSFTSAQLAANHVRFAHDGGEIAPTFSLQADDGAPSNNLSNVLAGSVTFTNVNDAPLVAASTTPTGSVSTSIPATTGGHSPAASAILASNALVSGLHGSGAGNYGTVALDRGDDNSSGRVDLTGVFGPTGINFFGHDYTYFYINNNGNITFSSATGQYTPSSIDAGLNNPIIAAFWADVDTRNSLSGRVYYDLDPVNGIVTITWDHVGYFSGHANKVNTFQIVLINEGDGNFDIVYRYGDIQWTTGDASGGSNGLGGTPARAGYSAGDNTHYYELPQSGNQPALLSLPATSPSIEFDVRNGDVTAHSVSANGVINFSDLDAGDVHLVQSVAYTGAGQAVGTITLDRVADTAGPETTGQFAWTYTASSSDVQSALLNSSNGTRIETFAVVISDGHGGSLTQSIAVTLTFSGGVQVGTIGPDTLTGTAGADVFYGQAGNDVFVFNAAHNPNGTGHDVIADFAPGHDRISLDYSAFNADSFSSWLSTHASASGNDVLLDLNFDGQHLGRDTILLKNIALGSLHASDFVVATGVA